MNNLSKHLIKYIFFILTFFYTSVCFSHESIVEEGWRLHKSFQIDIRHEKATNVIDFSDEHFAMAHMLRPPPLPRTITSKGGDKKDKADSKAEVVSKENYLCLIIFIPIIYKDEKIQRGETVCLTQEIFETLSSQQIKGKVSYPEIGFLSGSFNPDRTMKSSVLPEDLDNIALLPEERRDRIVIDSFALKLAQKIFINPKQLERALNHRYPHKNTPICFKDGNYEKLLDANQITKKNLTSLSAVKNQIIKDFQTFIDKGDVDGLTRQVGHLESKYPDKNASEKLFTEFSVNSQMNSYTCA